MDDSLFEIFKSELSDLGDANCDWWSEISIKTEEAKEKSNYGSPRFKTPLLSSKRERNSSCRVTQKRLKSAAELADSEPTSAAIIHPQLDWTSPVSSKLAAGVSSNQESGKVPSSLHPLLDDRSNVSWSSAFATPLASNVTWSNLNSEEKKVLMPSNSVTTPTAFSPGVDQELMDHCQLLDYTLDIAGISSQDPSLLEKCMGTKAAMEESQCSAILDKDERELPNLKEQIEDKNASQTLRDSDKFCLMKSEKTDSLREDTTPGPGVADDACSTRSNTIVDQNLNSSSTAVIRNLFKNFNNFSKPDPEYQISANDSATTGFSHAKLPGDSVDMKVQENYAVCPKLHTTSASNSQDFLNDLSFNTLNELCQTTEMIPPALCSPDDVLHSVKKVAVRRTSTPIVQPQNTKCQRRLKFLATEHEEDWTEEGDSIMEQAAQELQSPEKDITIPDAASRVQEIKKNASMLRRFVYSVNDDKLQEKNNSCKIQIKDLLKSAEILEQALMLDSNKKHRNLMNVKSMTNETQEFLSFSKLNSFSTAEIDNTVTDQMNDTPNRSYKSIRNNRSSISAVWNDTLGNENEAANSVYAAVTHKHLITKSTAVSSKRKRENETALVDNLEKGTYCTTPLPKQTYLSEYSTTNYVKREQNMLCVPNSSLSNDTVSEYTEKKITYSEETPRNLNSSSWNNEHRSSENLNGYNSNSGYMSDMQMVKAVEHAETMHTLKTSVSTNNYLSESTSLPSNKISAVQNTTQICQRSDEINTSDTSGNKTKEYNVTSDNSQMDAFTLNSTVVQQLFDDSPEDFKEFSSKSNQINPDKASNYLHHSLAAVSELNLNVFFDELYETKEPPDKIAPEIASALTYSLESSTSNIREKIVVSQKNAAEVEEHDAKSGLQQISEGRTSPILQGFSSITRRLRNKHSLAKDFEQPISRKETFKKPKFSIRQSKANVKESLDDFEDIQFKENKLQMYASSETRIVKTGSLLHSTNKDLLKQGSSAACSEKPHDALSNSAGITNESTTRTVRDFTYKNSSTKFEPCNSIVSSSAIESPSSVSSLAECKFEVKENPGYQMHEMPMQMVQKFQGFATASGKKIKISDEALQKVKKLFTEIDKEDTTGHYGVEPDDNLLMKTHIQSSGYIEMLDKTAELFAEDNKDVIEYLEHKQSETGMVNDTHYQGFTTANEKRINMSSETLNEAKKLFAEEDADERCQFEPNKTTVREVHFQGFATASGKKVNISSEALHKARKLFVEVHKENMKEICNLESSETSAAREKQVDICSESKLRTNESRAEFDKDENGNSCEPNPKQVLKIPQVQGFTIASGRKINPSSEALQQTKQLIAKVDREVISKEPESSESSTAEKANFQGFTRNTGKKAIRVDEGLFKAKKLIPEKNREVSKENYKPELNEPPSTVVPQIQGFAMASTNKENVSSNALLKTKKFLAEEDTYELEGNVTPKVSQFQGFATASGKKVTVSSKALLKAKKLFDEADSDEHCGFEVNELVSTEVPQFQGFSTASGKKVNVSSNALLKAKKFLAEEDTNELEGNVTPTVKVPQFQGFATASGKKVNVSSKALLKAKKLFDEADADEHCGFEVNELVSTEVPQFQGFSTASGKKVNVSSNALLKAKKFLAEEDTNELEGNVTPTVKVPQFQGFATASGKKVNVSSKALLKAKKLFDEEDVEEHCGFQVNELAATEVPQFQGFSTASGKKVNVSSSALLKAKKFLAEEDTNELEGNVTPLTKVPQFQGFATASGKKVTVSSKALLKAKKLFDEDNADEHYGFEVNELVSTEVPQFQGFATASGKKVSVSNKALMKAKKLFAEDNANEHCKLEENETASTKVSHIQSFETASRKKVNEYSKALLKAKKPFDKEDADKQCGFETNNTPSSEVAWFEGFATASGKKVNVSAEALLEAKKLFAEENTSEHFGHKENETPSTKAQFQGFATASGKKVSISNEALHKARKLFVEVDEDVCESIELESNKTPLTKAAHFDAAYGNKVSESNEALLKAKKLLIEENAKGYSKNCELDSSEILLTKVCVQGFPIQNNKVKKSEESLLETKTCEEFNNVKDNMHDSISDECLNLEGFAAQDIEDNRICITKSTAIKELNGLTANKCTCILEGKMCGDCRKKVSLSNANSESDTEGENVKIGANFHSEALNGMQKYINSDTSSENNHAFVIDSSKSMKTKSVQTKVVEPSWTLSQEVKESAAALLADDNWWSEGYISCPDMVNDRDMAPSAIFSDTSSSAPVPQPGSPILGRTKTQCKKSTGASQNCESLVSVGFKFKVPYKNCKTSGSAYSVSGKPLKRTRMNLDFGTPFAKRLRTVENVEDRKCDNKQSVEDVFRDVCAGRLAAAEEQECLIKKRLKLGPSGSRPCTGSLYAKKREQCLLRWRDVANGRPPEKYTMSELLKLGVKPDVLNVTAENALEYRFSASNYYSESLCLHNVKGIDVGDGALLVLALDGTAGLKEVTRAFLASPGIEPSLVPSGWVSNHYRWLIWKLAATERRFPLQFAGRCLTPHMLMLQLKYRYDREIDHSHRPALRKILEHDDSAAKRLVLCVARIINLQVKEGEPNYELELTDGWYGIMSCLDRDMCRFINKGIICIGTKLMTHGAELVNCEQACSPLEVGPNARLKLYSNSTRRVRWDTKLGFYPQPGPFSISLTSILPMGGPVGSAKVIVARKYPLVYIEKLDNGKSVVRSSKLEERVAAEWERKRQECAEALFSQVRAEFQQCSRQSSGPSCITDISKLSSGEELCRMIESCSDPGAFERMLSEEQKQVLTNYQTERQQQIQQELEGRMLQKLEDSSSASRTVIPVFKVRCMDLNVQTSQSAMLSIWRPSEEVMQLLKEGASMNLFNVAAAGQRGGHLQLSAGRNTRYQPLPNYTKIIPERIVVSLDRASATDFHPPFGEVDIVGIVVHIGAAPQHNSGFQIIYLSDIHMNILGVAFWGGVKQYGWEDLLVPRSIVAGCNLNKRHGAAVRWVPCVYASEYSSFSSHPRMAHLLHAFTSLQQSLSQQDMKKFYSACEEKVTFLLQGAVPASSRNRLPSVSLATNSSSSVGNAEVLQKTPESSAVQHRIRKLEQYGEPPPLSPLIALPVPSSLRREFHVPARRSSSDVVNDSPPLSLESDPG